MSSSTSLLFESCLIIETEDQEKSISIKDKKIFRILFFDDENEIVFLINISNDSLPFQLSNEEFMSRMENNHYSIYTGKDPFDTPIDLTIHDKDLVKTAKNKAKKQQIMEKRWLQIKNHVNNEPNIFYSSFRSTLIKREKKISKENKKEYTLSYIPYKDEYGKNCKCSLKYFLKYLKLYWKRGKCYSALSDDYKNCGSTDINLENPGKKRGQKYKEDPLGLIGRAPKKVDHQIFEFFIKKEIIKNKSGVKEAYEAMKRSVYFSNPEQLASAKQKTLSISEQDIDTLKQGPLSQRQFEVYYYNNYPPEQREKNRVSKRTYDLERAPKTGSQKALFPGHLFELDATVLDYYIVSHFYPYNLIGQPTLYLIIDVYSRFIIAWYLCLGRPSGENALRTLVNMATDKSELLNKIGYKKPSCCTKNDMFTIQGMPKGLVIDQAELRKNIPKHFQKTFGIQIIQTPAKQPKWKGTIEKRFDIVQRWNKMYDPSYGNYPKKKYGDPDVRLKAIRFFDEMYIEVTDAIFEHNYKPIDNPKLLNVSILEEGLSTTPVELFNHGIAKVGGSIKSFSRDKILRNLLKPGVATKTLQGIKYNGLFYLPQIDNVEEFLSSSKTTQYRKVALNNKLNILEHEQIVDQIYMPLDGYDDPIICNLLDSCNFQVQSTLPEGLDMNDKNSIKGMSWYEYNDIKEEYNKTKKKADEKYENIRDEINKRRKQRMEDAKKRTDKLTANLSNSAFLSGANERKKVLKEKQSKEEAAAIKEAYYSMDQTDTDAKQQPNDKQYYDDEIDYSDLIDDIEDEMEQDNE
ncbi:hypothetical protein [Endozoicomonas euniceicola]|uniref:Integrase catalytic domain-containing protein n=1 Tax=Endozoicomonas euniceicola TaxID=1234143 RepID=A0ABY6GSV5_9GAMM|nr:hypothetical protein [Endozoicomonas euniceicola]UYM15206.1 hypothetical protein NX720_20440 [Endozoicomonas euniceicola]